MPPVLALHIPLQLYYQPANKDSKGRRHKVWGNVARLFFFLFLSRKSFYRFDFEENTTSGMIRTWGRFEEKLEDDSTVIST